jgi:hypothetical protein
MMAPRSACSFRQRDVARTIKAARSAGLDVRGVKVDVRTGTIEIVTGETARQDSTDHGKEPNEWDTLLNVQ